MSERQPKHLHPAVVLGLSTTALALAAACSGELPAPRVGVHIDTNTASITTGMDNGAFANLLHDQGYTVNAVACAQEVVELNAHRGTTMIEQTDPTEMWKWSLKPGTFYIGDDCLNGPMTINDRVSLTATSMASISDPFEAAQATATYEQHVILMQPTPTPVVEIVQTQPEKPDLIKIFAVAWAGVGFMSSLGIAFLNTMRGNIAWSSTPINAQALLNERQASYENAMGRPLTEKEANVLHARVTQTVANHQQALEDADALLNVSGTIRTILLGSLGGPFTTVMLARKWRWASIPDRTHPGLSEALEEAEEVLAEGGTLEEAHSAATTASQLWIDNTSPQATAQAAVRLASRRQQARTTRKSVKTRAGGQTIDAIVQAAQSQWKKTMPPEEVARLGEAYKAHLKDKASNS